MLVDAEVELDLSPVRPGRGKRRGARRGCKLQRPELLDPVASAGLRYISPAAAFDLDADLARRYQPGRNGRLVEELRLARPLRADRVPLRMCWPFAACRITCANGISPSAEKWIVNGGLRPVASHVSVAGCPMRVSRENAVISILSGSFNRQLDAITPRTGGEQPSAEFYKRFRVRHHSDGPHTKQDNSQCLQHSNRGNISLIAAIWT